MKKQKTISTNIKGNPENLEGSSPNKIGCSRRFPPYRARVLDGHFVRTKINEIEVMPGTSNALGL
jgi:hypothetical protein